MKIVNIRISKGYGGAENYILYLFNYLLDKKFLEITHFTNNKILYESLLKNKQEAYILNKDLDEIGTKKEFINFFFALHNYYSSYKKIFNYLSVSGTKIVILHSTTEKILLTYLLKRKGYKIVWFEHGPFYRAYRFGLIKSLHMKSSFFVDKIFAVSKDTKNDLIEGGISAKKIDVCYIGVDLEYFKPNKKSSSLLKKKLKIKDNVCIVGYVGNVNNEKGINRFVEVANDINSKRNDFLFIVVGGGKELEKLKGRRLKNFVFTGHINNVKDYLQLFDIMLLPTNHNEGISLSIIESMAMETYVITKKIGGSFEVIDSVDNGVLYEDFSSKVLSKKIVDITSQFKKMKQVKKNSRQLVLNKFNIKYNSQIFLDSLMSIHGK
ncbi:MAG TPA: glycosyltransferase family 4 protein [Candidatus Woesebacteria bacterium]|nr:glycosyltransferase family 4 protein [Candidatus Woesebacteria bacterium]